MAIIDAVMNAFLALPPSAQRIAAVDGAVLVRTLVTFIATPKTTTIKG